MWVMNHTKSCNVHARFNELLSRTDARCFSKSETICSNILQNQFDTYHKYSKIAAIGSLKEFLEASLAPSWLLDVSGCKV